MDKDPALINPRVLQMASIQLQKKYCYIINAYSV